jgi:hypothetical protein
MAMHMKEKMNDAAVREDYNTTKELKIIKDSWQKSADDEKMLLEKCQLIQPCAQTMLTYHHKQEEFGKCV